MWLLNYNKRRAFILPIVFAVMVISLAIVSTLMSRVVVSLNRSLSDICGVRSGYAANAAYEAVKFDPYLNTVASSTACTAGSYIVFNSGTCALPGSAGTKLTLDSSCLYSAQVVSNTVGSLNINAIGVCNLGDCAGAGGSMLQLNASITTCVPTCTGGLGQACDVPNNCGGTCTCTAPLICGQAVPNICGNPV